MLRKTFILAVIVFMALSCSQDVIFVSPSGKDANSGLSAGKPVATFDKALELVKSKGINRLHLLEGVYRIEQPIILTSDFSGLHIEGTGAISGGKPITGWKPYKDGIWQVEIPAAKNGQWDFRQIYVNGKLRHRAKSPNEGFYRVAGCPEGTPSTVRYNTRCQTFEFNPGEFRPDWKNLEDVEVVVYYFWVDNHLPIESIDTTTNIVKFKYKSGMTFTDDFSEDGARYVIENIFEALDAPGEWYLDKPTGILYYMPMEGEDMAKVEVVAPFATELLRVEGVPEKGEFVENIYINGVSFEHCNFLFPPDMINGSQGSSQVAAAINLTGARDCKFEGCSFLNLGAYAIDMNAGCSGNSICDNRFRNLSAGGIRMSGGRAGSFPLTHTKNNQISRNEISDYGLNYPSAYAIFIRDGYGNNISQNHIHHGYHIGISVGWVWGYTRSITRDNIIERNHIHHIGYGLLSDMGAIYTLGTQPGTVIRNNLVHDIEANKYGGWGIYNDEGSTGVLVENNIVYNTKHAAYDMHFGRDVTVRNNIFAFARLEQIRRERGESHLSLFFENNIVYWKEGKLFGGDWRDREYQYYRRPFTPGDWLEYKRNFESDWNIFYNPNLKVEDVVFYSRLAMENGVEIPGVNADSFDGWRKRGYDVNSIYADPMFVDPDNYDFRLKPESPALKRGFIPIDLSGIPGR